MYIRITAPNHPLHGKSYEVIYKDGSGYIIDYKGDLKLILEKECKVL
jgi:hypothetical protein